MQYNESRKNNCYNCVELIFDFIKKTENKNKTIKKIY